MTAASNMTQPQEGDVLAGKFRIERVLGVGGMGMVVSAMHLQLEERIAIKFLLPEALSNAEAVARFGREARAAVKIKSEHVARVTDVGALETGAPYMVMELLRGQDLSQLLHAHGPLPVPLAAQYVLQACEALAEAHAIGIVHRDLKPANLFLTARADGSPCIKVLDFGISKLTTPLGSGSGSGSGSDMSMTRTQAVMGSPLYMSPEQMASARDVDQRSDIWAVGTVLYELVTARVPFEAETMPQLCAQILQNEPPPPRSIRPDLPEGIEQIIWRCLRKDRNQRYANVAELAADLASFAPDAGPRSAERISRVLSSSGALSVPPTSAKLLGGGATTGSSSAWGNTQTPRRSRAVWFGLAGLAAAGVAAVVLWKATVAPPAPQPDVSASAVNRAPSEVVTVSEPAPPPAAPPPAPSAAPLASESPEPSPAKKPLLKAAAVKAAAKAKAAASKPSVPGPDPLSERN